MEYLSIRAFAVRAGVSAQAIYKRLNNPKDELNNFLKLEGDKKVLSDEALSLFQAEQKKEDNSTSCQPVDNQLTTMIIDMLQSELEAKNKQIENLQQLLSQEQQLRLVADQRILMLQEAQAEEAEKVEAQEVEAAEPQEPETEQQPHKRWWQFWK